MAGLGSLAAVVFLDTSLLTPEQVYTFTHLPVLGAVPYLKPRLLKSTKIKEKSSLILGWEDNSEVIEPYRTLYNNILSDIFQGQMDNKSILLTSSTAGESKTIIASNLALVMAKMGRRVLLVDANFINPSVHRVFGIESRMSGFTDLLNKGTDFKAAIRDVTDILLGNIGLEAALKFKGLDRLKLVTAGSPVSDPGGLLKSENTNLVIEEFKKRFDCVILDGPAISASADSLSLAAHCEATFIVYSVGKTPRKSLKSALIQAGDTQEAGAGGGMAVKGVIVNLCI